MTKYLLLSLLSLLLLSCSSLQESKRAPNSHHSISGERVLYIGDSISAGPLGALIYDHLSKNVGPSGRANLYGVVSSSPRHWAPAKKSKGAKWLCKQRGRKNHQFPTNVSSDICPKRRNTSPIEHLVDKNNPTLVIFQFLGNSMGMSENSIINNVRSLLDQSAQARCIFITSPPYHQSIDSFNDRRSLTADRFVKAIDGRCEIFNGMAADNLEGFRTKRSYYAGDKKHLSREGSKVFFNELKKLL